MSDETKEPQVQEKIDSIKKCKAKKVPNKKLFEAYNISQELKHKQKEMVKQLEHIKKSSVPSRIKTILATSKVKVEEIEEIINAIKHTLISNIKGFIAYKRTESKLGAYHKFGKFIKRFTMILTEPSLPGNNDLENLIKKYMRNTIYILRTKIKN